jgi:hypothetical protein
MKIRKFIYKFIQLRQILNKEILKTVYFCLVESVIRYGILVWGSTNFTHIEPLFKVQKLILRIIRNKHFLYPSKHLFQEFEVLSIRQLYIHKILTFIRKNQQFTNFIDYPQNTRRRNTDLVIQRMNTSFGQRCIIYNGPRLFNYLPLNIKEPVNSFQVYKKKTKKWLINLGIECSEQLALISQL